VPQHIDGLVYLLSSSLSERKVNGWWAAVNNSTEVQADTGGLGINPAFVVVCTYSTGRDR
jgi:hypothetical protein